MKDKSSDEEIVTTEAQISRKISALKYFFGSSNCEKIRKADSNSGCRDTLEKVPIEKTLTTSDRFASEITDATAFSYNYSMNIEVPKQSQMGALFSFTNIFSLERKVIFVEETIDPDDVATSPLHETDDYRKELFLWSIVSAEASAQDYTACSCRSNSENESVDSGTQQTKSLILPLVSDEHTNVALETHLEDSSGLTGAILTSRFSEKLDGSDCKHIRNSNVVLIENSAVPDALVISGCSRAKRMSLRRFLFGPKKSKIDIMSTTTTRTDQSGDAVSPDVGGAVIRSDKLSGKDEYGDEINTRKDSDAMGENGSMSEPLTDCESVSPVLHEYIPSGK